ncbi:DUF411 domain-containing protein [Thalassotalea piscium]|uniref:DUF411 domain-containing protein n=1 Tax=Thalassotalea piscium TaxID=1230533 RepID=A0A7X0NFK3_9GAMM|nr:DUF411 domain-containing protein [Thalassotalea piscium]MBB6542529.1 hypothetical protein [Thalassotalea piscium]
MFSNKLTLLFFIIAMPLALLAGCSDNTAVTKNVITQKHEAITLAIHKSPLCGCCNDWINHVNSHGFQSIVHDEDNVSTVKDKMGIEPRYRSCHTAISENGYAFEGHVPAKFIQQFLNETHANDVIGLSVPAMPVGTPGMEVDDRFDPYRILLLKSDGSYEIYAEVHTYEEQF